MGMLAWIIGGVASILGALTFAEVAVLIPKTGGMVTYLGEVYNDKIGFLAGWMQVIIFYPAFLAGYGVRVGQELAEYVGSQYALPIGMAVIIILVAINTLGNKTASGRADSFPPSASLSRWYADGIWLHTRRRRTPHIHPHGR